MDKNQKKNLIYSAVLITLVLIVYFYRSSKAQEMTVSGVTMGVVSYNVKYLDVEKRDLTEEIKELLAAFNESLSTYIQYSEISEFNRDSSVEFRSRFFYPVLQKSKEIYKVTEGSFDPTVMPLVNAWGFGPDKEPYADKGVVDSLLQYVGFDKVGFDKEKVWKLKEGIQLDFSAIAKGYAVDLVGELLLEHGIKDFMVEIGGELICYGKNKNGEAWLIGINNPYYLEKGGDLLSAKIRVENKALATSGNYQNFYEKDGKKYAHTIDPVSGVPVQHSLLSASVFADDCMTADAFATSFMVIGVERAIKILESQPNLEGFLIYDEGGEVKTYQTKGLAKYFVE
ncbi:FAD:protein FMN transferase [Flammeovirgaceae bacterium SG7u.111]|nr:FAD:protein FMN transferase [Flammeovirgaceae bacterium SG7u.132]WPO35345.1 FAD:protein FMN transferase [Flammeovirgaceae bacterium SG7u.111]